MKKNTIIWVSVIVIFVIGVVVSGKFLTKSNTVTSTPTPIAQREIVVEDETLNTRPTEKPTEQLVVLYLDNNNPIEQKLKATTAFEALSFLAKSKNIPVELKEYKFGSMVEKIGDKANSKDGTWVFFVNGKAGNVAADRFPVYPGDKVEWKYSK